MGGAEKGASGLECPAFIPVFAQSPLFAPPPLHPGAGLRHLGKAEASADEVRAYLERAYCGRLSVETSQLRGAEEREWMADRFEELKSAAFSSDERRSLAKLMLESQVGRRERPPVDVAKS